MNALEEVLDTLRDIGSNMDSLWTPDDKQKLALLNEALWEPEAEVETLRRAVGLCPDGLPHGAHQCDHTPATPEQRLRALADYARKDPVGMRIDALERTLNDPTATEDLLRRRLGLTSWTGVAPPHTAW